MTRVDHRLVSLPRFVPFFARISVLVFVMRHLLVFGSQQRWCWCFFVLYQENWNFNPMLCFLPLQCNSIWRLAGGANSGTACICICALCIRLQTMCKIQLNFDFKWNELVFFSHLKHFNQFTETQTWSHNNLIRFFPCCRTYLHNEIGLLCSFTCGGLMRAFKIDKEHFLLTFGWTNNSR